MDFFAHQEAARRRTFLLVGAYAAAVALIILSVYLAFTAAFIGLDARRTGEPDLGRVWDPLRFGWVAGATLLVVLLGTAGKIAQLREGGVAVARMLGGRLVPATSSEPGERRVLNVVEEMAIASGTAVPQVFVLDDEPGINAFAAGFSPSDAVVAVTRGCVERLSRDELQGVVAHEFSHILNGDMRLNVRLLGVLNGILVIAMAGYWILRAALRSGGGGRSRSRGKGNPLPLALFGLLLMIVGYVGVFFGKLIKSAVSRQREFLADASAVQFTRNPDGLAGALKKIGALFAGSRLRSPRAEEASHFYFANGLAARFLDMFATHPPLAQRIRRLDPSFDGDFSRAPAAVAGEPAAARPFAQAPARLGADPGQTVSRVGAPTAEHVDRARGIAAAIPPRLAEAAREPSGALAVVYGLLLSSDGSVRAAQERLLRERAGGATLAQAQALAPLIAALPPGLALPLLDMAVPSLRSLSGPQYARFSAAVDGLVRADAAIDLFEFALQRVLRRRLAPAFEGARPAPARRGDLRPLLPACAELLSALAYWGAEETPAAEMAFRRGAEALGAAEPLEMAPVSEAGLDMVDRALARLDAAAPAIKRRVVAACVACVAADGTVTDEEAELLRAVADSLDCPMPPFLPAR